MPVLARYLQGYLQFTCSSISLAKSSRRNRSARRPGQHASTTILALAVAGRCTCILAGPSVAYEYASATTCEYRFLQVTTMPVLAGYLQFYLQFTCSCILLARSSAMFQAKNGVPFLGSGGFQSTIFTIFSTNLLCGPPIGSLGHWQATITNRNYENKKQTPRDILNPKQLLNNTDCIGPLFPIALRVPRPHAAASVPTIAPHIATPLALISGPPRRVGGESVRRPGSS